MKRTWLAFVKAVSGPVLCLMSFGPLMAAGVQNDILYCGYTNTPPKIDGDLSDPCWRLAGQAVDFLELSRTATAKADKQTTVSALWTRDTFYLSARCEEATPGKILRNSARKAYDNDCVEFFIAPAIAKGYYQFSVDTLPGNLYEEWNGDASSKSNSRYASQVSASSWSIELAIPFSAFKKYPVSGDRWRINLGREDYVAHSLSVWAPTDRFQNASLFGTMCFVARVPEDRQQASHFETSTLKRSPTVTIPAIASLGIPGYDLPMTAPLVTDHIPWAKPLAGGPIKAFFTMYRLYSGARDFVELAQRVDLDYDVVVAGQASETFERVNERLAHDGYDVFVLPAMDYGEDLKALILKRVREGRGLVIVENVVNYAGNLLEENRLPAVGTDHYLLHDLPLDDLPGILDGIDAGSFGKGRAVVLRFDREKSYFSGVWPSERGHAGYGQRQHRYWEGWHALLGRAIAWAARRDTEDRVTCKVSGRSVFGHLVSSDRRARLKLHVRSARELRFDGTLLPAVRVSGDTDVTARMPRDFPQGSLLVDAWVTGAEGRIRYWACKRLDAPQAATIEECVPAREFFEPGQPVSARLSIKARQACRVVLRYCTLDAWERRLAEQEVSLSLKAGQTRTLTLRLDLSRTLSTSNRLFARLMVGGREADSRWTCLYLPHVTRRIVQEDWHTTSWGASYCPLPLHKYYCDLLRGLGIKDEMGEYEMVDNAMCGGRVEAPPRFIFDSYVTGAEKDRSNIRKPCLSDPDTQKKIEDESIKYSEESRKYGLYGVYVAGEAMLCAGTVGIHEVCLCPRCEARYQQWLRERYGGIDKLNSQWGTSYTRFEQCKGMLTAEARRLENLSPFVDFREFMTEVWVDALHCATDSYRKMDPGLRVGYTHCFGAVPLGGTDFYRLSRHAGFTWGQEYHEGYKDEARFASFMVWRSFCPDEWPDLSWSGYNHDPAYLEYEPWWLALHGSRGISYHQVNCLELGRSSAVVFPTMAYTETSRRIRDTLKDLVDGMGKVFMDFKPYSPRIGIVWSYPSLITAWCEDNLDYWQASEGENDKAYGTWYKSAYYLRLLCEDLQLEYRYVAPEQLLNENALNRFDCIFLPMTIAASPQLINALQQFVNNGGMVVGDFRCLRTDEHGKPFPDSDQQLEKLFGVRRTGHEAVYGPRSIEFVGKDRQIVLQGKAIPGTCAEELVAAKETTTLASHKQGWPAVVLRRAGKGQTVYLNTVLPKYDPVARELLRQVMAAAGVPRDITVTGNNTITPPRAYQVTRFSRGGTEVIGVLRDFRRSTGEPAIRIDFGRTTHVYDARGGKYLGYTDRIRTAIRPAQARVYALLPYKVIGMRLTAPKTSRGGVDLPYHASLLVSGRSSAGDHVFHIEVREPGGKVVYPYCRNTLAEEGRTDGTIPLALNDRPGIWTLRVRDVLTGVHNDLKFTIANSTR